MNYEDWILFQWSLNHWEELMTSEQYEMWWMEELSKYESLKEYYENNW